MSHPTILLTVPSPSPPFLTATLLRPFAGGHIAFDKFHKLILWVATFCVQGVTVLEYGKKVRRTMPRLTSRTVLPLFRLTSHALLSCSVLRGIGRGSHGVAPALCSCCYTYIQEGKKHAHAIVKVKFPTGTIGSDECVALKFHICTFLRTRTSTSSSR